MNPSPPVPSLPTLDATCDRIVAALTQRLARAAQSVERPAPETHHDFLVPIVHPEMAETIESPACRAR